MKINRLISGGIITNYYCSSKCKHCLYNCSAQWPKDYINKNATIDTLEIIKSLGCTSVHIGGGEPFLNPQKLIDCLNAFQKHNVNVDYIETNSSWFKNDTESFEILRTIKNFGVNTLLISISPFHNEYIPFIKVKNLISACCKEGIHVFPWSENFYNDINQFDENTTHKLQEYQEKFGDSYINRIPYKYWINYGGRSINLFSEIFNCENLDEILESPPCRELADTSHFHLDLYGNFIPGLCSGLIIHKKDLGKELSSSYKIINILYNEGIGSLYQFALENNFSPEPKYLNKCHLCTRIREHLVDINFESKDLRNREFYKHF